MPRQTQKPDGPALDKPQANTSEPSGETPDKITIRRPARAELSPEETRARMETFAQEREEAFVAAVREDKD